MHGESMKHYQTEDELEADCTDYVTDRGGLHRKLDVGPGAKGQLDHAYWLPGAFHFVVEFKLPGKPASPLQRRRLERLQAMGHEAWLCDSYEAFTAYGSRLMSV